MIWYNSYSIGNEEIDNHHRTLFRLFNLTHEYCSKKQEAYTCQMCIKDLISYAEYHFSAEEHLMRVAEYKDMEKHIIEHNHFRERVLDLSCKVENSDIYVHEELLIFLGNWLINHVVVEDKKLSILTINPKGENPNGKCT